MERGVMERGEDDEERGGEVGWYRGGDIEGR